MSVSEHRCEFVGGPLDGKFCAVLSNTGATPYGHRQKIQDGERVRVAVYLRRGEQMVFDGWEAGMGDSPTLGEA